MVTVYGIVPGSEADRLGIKVGDKLYTVNGSEINDVLDYRFYLTDKRSYFPSNVTVKNIKLKYTRKCTPISDLSLKLILWIRSTLAETGAFSVLSTNYQKE